MPDVTSPPGRILLTGAAGFVGRHLVSVLAATYPETTLLTPTVDVRDAAAVAAIVETELPEICIHLAGVSTVAAARRDEDHAWQVNLHGTLHVARAILRHAPNCQMMFISTGDAYGAGRAGESIDEAAPLAPTNVYAATKAAADLALGSMAGQGLRVVRLRPFNHTGPGQSAEFVVPAFARQIARIAAGLQPPLLEVGNLDTWRDFLDVRDICAGYAACVARRNELTSGVILNLCSGTARKIANVLAELLTLAGIVAEVRSDPSRMRAAAVQCSPGNAARARELLGWAPTTPWTQTLRDVLEYWRARIAASPTGA